jgi:hypothetical protein
VRKRRDEQPRRAAVSRVDAELKLRSPARANTDAKKAVAKW